MEYTLKINDKVRILGNGTYGGDVGIITRLVPNYECYVVELKEIRLPFFLSELEKM